MNPGMTFTNPDATFVQQAERVNTLYQRIGEVRDRRSLSETDARRVNLNNVMMAANASMATLRLLGWAKQGGYGVLIQALGLARPEYITPVTEDLLRGSRLFLLLESQFQIETLFHNILLTLGRATEKQGYYNVAQDVISAAGLADPDSEATGAQCASPDAELHALERDSSWPEGLRYRRGTERRRVSIRARQTRAVRKLVSHRDRAAGQLRRG